MNALVRLFRHIWLDAEDAHRALGAAGLQRLEARIRDSETRHTGEICLCVEASLPLSYLWRHLRGGEAIADVVRERAVTLFGKQRVWDTELNNGVLIYLQLAEHSIEIVADRGLSRHVAAEHWRATVDGMTDAFRAGRLEEGINRAIDAVSAVLEVHFPQPAGPAGKAGDLGDQLPNRPVLR